MVEDEKKFEYHILDESSQTPIEKLHQHFISQANADDAVAVPVPTSAQASATVSKPAEAPTKLSLLISGGEEGSANNTNSLFVALYLIILAFFIMLVARSQIVMKKHEDAMQSVSEAFSYNPDMIIKPLIKAVPPMGQDIALRAYMAPLGDVAKQSVSLRDVEVNEYGNTLQLKIPVNLLFEPNSFTVRKEETGFLVKLAQELKKLQANAKIDMELLIGSPALSDLPTAQNTMSLARAGSIARTMVDSGVYEESLFVGVVPQALSDTVIMRFYQRAEVQAPLDGTTPSSNPETETKHE